MRLISNEEMLLVAGGNYYWPQWQVEEFESMFSEFSYGFDSIDFGANGKAVAKKEVLPAEKATLVSELVKLFPTGTIKVEAKIKGTQDTVETWEIKVTIDVTNKKK